MSGRATIHVPLPDAEHIYHVHAEGRLLSAERYGGGRDWFRAQ